MTACGSFVGVKLFLAPQAYTGKGLCVPMRPLRTLRFPNNRSAV